MVLGTSGLSDPADDSDSPSIDADSLEESELEDEDESLLGLLAWSPSLWTSRSTSPMGLRFGVGSPSSPSMSPSGNNRFFSEDVQMLELARLRLK